MPQKHFTAKIQLVITATVEPNLEVGGGGLLVQIASYIAGLGKTKLLQTVQVNRSARGELLCSALAAVLVCITVLIMGILSCSRPRFVIWDAGLLSPCWQAPEQLLQAVNAMAPFKELHI